MGSPVFSSIPSNPITRHPHPNSRYEVSPPLCLLAVSLSFIEAETLEEKCKVCCKDSDSTTVRTTIKSTVRPPAPTTTLDPNYCKDFKCDDCSGAGFSTMSVAFVLMSVMMSLHV